MPKGRYKSLKGQVWWKSLTDEQKSAFIEKKERSRHQKRDAHLAGKRKNLPNGAVLIHYDVDTFSVYKEEMLDKSGNPLPKWL